MMVNKLSVFVIGMMLVAIVGIGFFNFVTDMASNYNVSVPEGFNNTNRALNQSLFESQGLANEMSNKTESSGGLTVLDTGAILLGAIWDIVKLPFRMIKIITTIVTDVTSNTIGIAIPGYIVGGILAIIAAVIGFIILSIVLKRDV